MEDWYKVTSKDINANHGEGLLYIYKSPSKLITSLISEHQWEPWRFSGSTWDKSITSHFMRYLALLIFFFDYIATQFVFLIALLLCWGRN